MLFMAARIRMSAAPMPIVGFEKICITMIEGSASDESVRNPSGPRPTSPSRWLISPKAGWYIQHQDHGHHDDRGDGRQVERHLEQGLGAVRERIDQRRQHEREADAAEHHHGRVQERVDEGLPEDRVAEQGRKVAQADEPDRACQRQFNTL